MPLSSLTPVDGSGLRGGADATPTRVPVKNPSRLVYDIAGRGFTRSAAALDVENPRADIGSTLNPALRFFVFDAEPNMDRLLPPAPELPLPAAAAGHDRRAPSSTASSGRRSAARRPPAERQIAEARDCRSGAAGQAVAGGGCRSAVGGADEAGVPVDLLRGHEP